VPQAEEFAVVPVGYCLWHFEKNLKHAVAPEWRDSSGRWTPSARDPCSDQHLDLDPTFLSRQRLRSRRGFPNWHGRGASRGQGRVEKPLSSSAGEGEGEGKEEYQRRSLDKSKDISSGCHGNAKSPLVLLGLSIGGLRQSQRVAKTATHLARPQGSKVHTTHTPAASPYEEGMIEKRKEKRRITSHEREEKYVPRLEITLRSTRAIHIC